MLALLLFAAALRILGISYPVWTDEGWSIWASSDPTQVIGILAADRHPPLYFAALSLWRIPAGDTHLALRFLSIAAGLILVALVYRIGADVFGRPAGIFAVLLFAALPIAVYYAQEIRHYGWLALFSALSWLIFLRYLKRPTRSLWVAYVLSITAMLYTLYFAVFTLAVQGVIILTSPPNPLSIKWRGEADRRTTGSHEAGVRFRAKIALIGAWLSAAILYIPWLYVIVTQQAGILGSGISGFPGTLSVDNVISVVQTVFSAQMAIPLIA